MRMGYHWDLISLVLVGVVLCAQTRAQTRNTYYGRNYYSALVTPTSQYYQQQYTNAYPTLNYSHDLVPADSKRKEYAKPTYSKNISYRPFASDEEDLSSERYSSNEYSNESHNYASKESDNSGEYNIATHIRVQHPITVPKKHASPHPKYNKYTSISPYKSSSSSSSYSDVNLSAESAQDIKVFTPQQKRPQKYVPLFEHDPFHVVTPPKSTAQTALASTGYNVYEPEDEEYDVAPLSNKAKASLRESFKGVASKKQIDKYLEDQQKLLDEALKLQLLNNPKFQRLLKITNQDHEQYDKVHEYEHDLTPPHTLFRPNFGPRRNHRRPGSELKRLPKVNPTQPTRNKRKFRSPLVINV